MADPERENLVQETLRKAVHLIKSGEKESGLRLLKRILNKEPDHEEAWFWMSYCVSAPEKQIFSLRQVLRVNPENSIARERLTILLEAAGDTSRKMKQHLPGLDRRISSEPDENDSGRMNPITFTGMMVAGAVLLLAVLLLAGGGLYFSEHRSGSFKGQESGNTLWGTEEIGAFYFNGIFYAREGEEIIVSYTAAIRSGELRLQIRPMFLLWETIGSPDGEGTTSVWIEQSGQGQFSFVAEESGMYGIKPYGGAGRDGEYDVEFSVDWSVSEP